MSRLFVGWRQLDSDYGWQAGTLILGSWLCGCIGVGALFGRPKTGLAIGLVLFGINILVFTALLFSGLSVARPPQP
jgi:hypothetical protein